MSAQSDSGPHQGSEAESIAMLPNLMKVRFAMKTHSKGTMASVQSQQHDCMCIAAHDTRREGMLVGGTNKKHMVTYQVDPREDALEVSSEVPHPSVFQTHESKGSLRMFAIKSAKINVALYIAASPAALTTKDDGIHGSMKFRAACSI